MIGGDFDLLDACFLVAVDSSESEEKLLWSWQTPDEIIRHAQAKIRIRRVGCRHQELLGVNIGLANLFQAVELMLINKTGIVGLHP